MVRARWGPGSLTPEQEVALDRLRDLAPDAVGVLGELLACDSPKVRLAAAQEILDRTYGRIDNQTKTTVTHRMGLPEAESPEDQIAQLERAAAALRERQRQIVEMVPLEGGLVPHPCSETGDDL